MSSYVRTAMAALGFAIGCAAVCSAQQPAQPTGPLLLQPMQNGVVLAPEIKVTKFDGHVGTLAGGYGGWVNDEHLLMGAAGYWLTDRKNDSRNLAYGGLVIGWFFDPDRPVAVSARTLLGFGRASETSTLAVPLCPRPADRPCYFGGARFDPQIDAVVDRAVRFRRDFLLAEPEIDVVARLSRMLSLTAGAGYRIATEERRSNLNPRGVTGTISAQFKF